MQRLNCYYNIINIIVRSWKAVKGSFKLKSLVAKFHIYAQLIKLRIYNNVCVDNRRKEILELFIWN